MRKRASEPEVTVADLLDAAQRGDFGSLFGNDAEDWWSFVRERLELGADQLILRMDDHTWRLWVAYEVADSGRALAMVQMFIADYEKSPETRAVAIPEGYEEVPYFTLPVDAAMRSLAARKTG